MTFSAPPENLSCKNTISDVKGGGAVKIEFPEYVLRILGAYENTGYEAYAVGGCVRDSLLGRTPHDWDIASSARPDETMRIMAPPVFR